MDPHDFIGSYQNVVSHLARTHPVMAQYLVGALPPQLKRKSNLDMIVRGHQRVLEKPTQQLPRISKAEFQDSTHQLASIFTYGSRGIAPNPYRANKFIRILRIMGDDRYIPLQEHWKEKKRRQVRQKKTTKS